jgi:hypothetical protein
MMLLVVDQGPQKEILILVTNQMVVLRRAHRMHCCEIIEGPKQNYALLSTRVLLHVHAPNIEAHATN